MPERDKGEIKALLSKNQDVLRVRLKDALDVRGWDRTTLSERSGVARSTIYNFLSGSKLGLAALYSIAEALDVSEEFLLGATHESARRAEQAPIPSPALPRQMTSDDLELSDKIARLTSDNRSIVESIVDLMLAQNNQRPKRR